jgi:hypothetical protein
MRSRALLAILAGMAVQIASRGDLSVLAPDSPFGGTGSHQSAGTTVATFELRGIMAAPDGMRYCIYDTARRASVWAAIGEPGNPFVLVSAGTDLNQVTMERNGQLVELTLKDSKVAAAPLLADKMEAAARPEVVVHSGRGRQPGDVRAPVPASPQ